jgi:signal transduction histidine kinase
MRWVGRLFDERYTLVRLLLLDLSGIGYLTFTPGAQYRPGAAEWGLGVAAFVVMPALSRWPLANLIGQLGLLVVGFAVIPAEPVIHIVGCSWALFELAMRPVRPRVVIAGSLAVTAVYVAGSAGGSLFDYGRVLYGLLTTAGLPLLLGLNLRSTREVARQAEERAAEERRRRDSESRAARADERGAIARELHDVVAHHVASIVLRIGVARHVLPGVTPDVAEVFDDVHATGTAALTDLRRLVAVLRTPGGVRDAALTAIDPGALPAALGAAVDRARGTGLTVDADVAAAAGALDAARGLAVLRLTQEALTNVAKHAGADARVRLSVAVIDDVVQWEVRDDGGTGPAPAAAQGGGHGLTGMRERVTVLGGRLEAGPHGAGWLLRASLPPPPATGPRPTTAQPADPDADPPAGPSEGRRPAAHPVVAPVAGSGRQPAAGPVRPGAA